MEPFAESSARRISSSKKDANGPEIHPQILHCDSEMRMPGCIHIANVGNPPLSSRWRSSTPCFIRSWVHRWRRDHDRKCLNRAEEVDGEHLGGDTPDARVSPDGQYRSKRCNQQPLDLAHHRRRDNNRKCSSAVAGKKMGQNSTSSLIAELQSHCTATSMLS